MIILGTFVFLRGVCNHAPEINQRIHRAIGSYRDESDICINSILNLESIEEKVVKYLIYHECIHREIYGHGPVFREKEHKYPDFQR